MPKIDKVGVAWGVLFAVLINGLYDFFASFLNGKFYEGSVFLTATAITGLIVVIAFRNLLFTDAK